MTRGCDLCGQVGPCPLCVPRRDDLDDRYCPTCLWLLGDSGHGEAHRAEMRRRAGRRAS